MLPEAFAIIFIHPMKVRIHSISNGCLSFMTQCHISQADPVPKLGYFARNLSVYLDEELTIKGLIILSETYTIIHISLRKVKNTQAAMGVCPYDTVSHLPG